MNYLYKFHRTIVQVAETAIVQQKKFTTARIAYINVFHIGKDEIVQIYL